MNVHRGNVGEIEVPNTRVSLTEKAPNTRVNRKLLSKV